MEITCTRRSVINSTYTSYYFHYDFIVLLSWPESSAAVIDTWIGHGMYLQSRYIGIDYWTINNVGRIEGGRYNEWIVVPIHHLQ